MFPIVGSFSFFFRRGSPPEVVVLTIIIISAIFVWLRDELIVFLVMRLIESLVPVIVFWVGPGS
jgi:hypothetical protein